MGYVTAPFTGAQIAVDQVGTVNYQKIKVTFGVDGAATDVTSATPFPVTDASIHPATGAFAISPSDSVNFTTPTRAIYVGSGGNIVAVIGGTTVTFTAVPTGSVLPIVASRVNLTSTTAGSMVGLT